MVKLITIVFILALSFNFYPQTSSSFYYPQNEFGLTSPGALKFGLYGYDNPALLSNLHQFDLYFAWSDAGGWASFNNWGIFSAFPGFGFGAVHKSISKYSVTDYKLSAALGSKSFSIGFGYGWSAGDLDFFNRSDIFTIGTLYRPIKYLSIGLIGNLSTSRRSEGAVDIALRPFGSDPMGITFFGDYIFQENLPSEAVNWSAGTAIEPFPGIRFTGRYFENKFFNIGVQLSFGRTGFTAQTNFNNDSKHINNVYGIRVGAYDRNPFSELFTKRNYTEINLLGNVKYQQFKLFDNSNTLQNLISQIEASKNDKTISGIAINTSGMDINKEMLWELREKLLEFKKSGKHIVIYIDRVNIDGYHLASAADKIVMDPQGIIALEGYLLGRQFYKGTLEKAGIGFNELRYFEFKSAMESFSREKMSKADRMQREAVVEDYYHLAKTEICKARNISEEKFDNLVNDEAVFLPKDALENNLVDSLGRWDMVKDIIKKIEGDEKGFVGAGSLAEFNLPEDDYWGEKPEIAVIYAIGICAMDEGINARQLVKDVEAAANNFNIKAVILRVDSPGGDGLASDIIAEALRKCKEKKPVIVSQGYVAASGGYWLSMYADTIVAAPNSITGSIGVISGWFYNTELKDKLGVTTDFVKRGEHADLGFGMSLPLIGIPLPDRDMTDEEKEKAELLIKNLYKEFTAKVAAGRNLDISYVDSIGQGRFYSGCDGLKIKLIDVLGGLDKAIDIAAEKSGLKGEEYEIVEYPEPPLFDFNFLTPKLFGIEITENKFLNYLKFRLMNNGYPIPMLPMDGMDLIPLE